MRFVQGRRLLTYVRSYPNRPTRPKGLDRYPAILPQPQAPFGIPWPRPFVLQLMEDMERLLPEEKLKFGYIFSELLGLPKPRKRKTKDTGDKFAVKLVKFDPDRKMEVLREVALVKTTVVVIKSLHELDLGPSMDAMREVPSVIKKGVSKEEASKIIAKIEAAGGVAVMEPLE